MGLPSRFYFVVCCDLQSGYLSFFSIHSAPGALQQLLNIVIVQKNKRNLSITVRKKKMVNLFVLSRIEMKFVLLLKHERWKKLGN